MWSFFSRDPSKDFPFDIGESVGGLEDRSIWRLHKAKKKVEFIFVYTYWFYLLAAEWVINVQNLI